MRYSRRKTVELTEEMLRLRNDEKLTWTEIAKRLDVTLTWLQYRREKIPGIAGRLTLDGSAANIAMARAMRERRIPWKIIARELGVEKWQTLARAVYVDKPIAP